LIREHTFIQLHLPETYAQRSSYTRKLARVQNKLAERIPFKIRNTAAYEIVIVCTFAHISYPRFIYIHEHVHVVLLKYAYQIYRLNTFRQKILRRIS